MSIKKNITKNKSLKKNIKNKSLKKNIKNKFLKKNITKNKSLKKNITKNKFLKKNITKNKFLKKNITKNKILKKNITKNKILKKNISKNKFLKKKHSFKKIYSFKGGTSQGSSRFYTVGSSGIFCTDLSVTFKRDDIDERITDTSDYESIIEDSIPPISGATLTILGKLKDVDLDDNPTQINNDYITGCINAIENKCPQYNHDDKILKLKIEALNNGIPHLMAYLRGIKRKLNHDKSEDDVFISWLDHLLYFLKIKKDKKLYGICVFTYGNITGFVSVAFSDNNIMGSDFSRDTSFNGERKALCFNIKEKSTYNIDIEYAELFSILFRLLLCCDKGHDLTNLTDKNRSNKLRVKTLKIVSRLKEEFDNMMIRMSPMTPITSHFFSFTSGIFNHCISDFNSIEDKLLHGFLVLMHNLNKLNVKEPVSRSKCRNKEWADLWIDLISPKNGEKIHMIQNAMGRETILRTIIPDGEPVLSVSTIYDGGCKLSKGGIRFKLLEEGVNGNDSGQGSLYPYILQFLVSRGNNYTFKRERFASFASSDPLQKNPNKSRLLRKIYRNTTGITTGIFLGPNQKYHSEKIAIDELRNIAIDAKFYPEIFDPDPECLLIESGVIIQEMVSNWTQVLPGQPGSDEDNYLTTKTLCDVTQMFETLGIVEGNYITVHNDRPAAIIQIILHLILYYGKAARMNMNQAAMAVNKALKVLTAQSQDVLVQKVKDAELKLQAQVKDAESALQAQVSPPSESSSSASSSSASSSSSELQTALYELHTKKNTALKELYEEIVKVQVPGENAKSERQVQAQALEEAYAALVAMEPASTSKANCHPVYLHTQGNNICGGKKQIYEKDYNVHYNFDILNSDILLLLDNKSFHGGAALTESDELYDLTKEELSELYDIYRGGLFSNNVKKSLLYFDYLEEKGKTILEEKGKIISIKYNEIDEPSEYTSLVQYILKIKDEIKFAYFLSILTPDDKEEFIRYVVSNTISMHETCISLQYPLIYPGIDKDIRTLNLCQLIEEIRKKLNCTYDEMIKVLSNYPNIIDDYIRFKTEADAEERQMEEAEAQETGEQPGTATGPVPQSPGPPPPPSAVPPHQSVPPPPGPSPGRPPPGTSSNGQEEAKMQEEAETGEQAQRKEAQPVPPSPPPPPHSSAVPLTEDQTAERMRMNADDTAHWKEYLAEHAQEEADAKRQEATRERAQGKKRPPTERSRSPHRLGHPRGIRRGVVNNQ